MPSGGVTPISVRAGAQEPTAGTGQEVRRLRELDALSERLFGDLDLEERLRALCDFLVPQFADWIVVTLSEAGSRTPKIVAVGHYDATRSAALNTELKGQPYGPSDRPVWAESANPEIALALDIGNGRLGVIHLGVTVHEPSDAAFFEAVAARCALALRASLMYEDQRRISLTFQNAALATELPKLEGFRFDALYEAGQAEALVGGDWYDAFQVEDGRVVLSIGDVAGSGLNAAVAMMNVRQAIRGVAQVHPDPSVMLAAAERTLRMQHKDLLVTAFVAVLDPITQQCSYANAGHPPALVRTADGQIYPLRGTRFPLGVSTAEPNFEVRHAPLSAGSLLLLYTDGLIESTRNVIEGEQRLYEALEGADLPIFENVARRIYDVVLGGTAVDDVAILCVRIESEKDMLRWRLDPMWDDAARRVRLEICGELQSAGYSAGNRLDFEVIFSELMSNVIRYAGGTVEVLLERHAGKFVLHVLDKGDGFVFLPRLPADLFSEFGRGLFLVANLATDFSVERRPGGGSHARVVLTKSQGDHLHVR